MRSITRDPTRSTPPTGRRGVRPRAADVVAGVSVALVLIPQSLAYAALAGLPSEVGLIAAALPPMVASAVGSSPVLQTGPVALTSLLTLGLLSGHADAGTQEYVALAALLAVMIGVIRLVVGALGAGRIAYAMTRPIVLGFTSGAALLIISSQIPTALGRGDLEGHVFGRAVLAVLEPSHWNLAAVGFAIGAGGAVLVGRRIDRRVPGVLVAVVAGIVVSRAAGFGGPVVGELPDLVPALDLTLPWGSVLVLLVPAIVMSVVDFAEPAAIARRYADEDGHAWNASREFLGQGAANLVSGLTGGYPVGGSFSRSSLGRLVGAQTRWTGVVSGAVVLAFLPFAGMLASLPEAILAGVVIVAVAGLFQPMAIVTMWHRRRGDAAVALTTFALTIVTSPRIDRAIVIAVGGELALIAYRRLRDRRSG